MAQSNGNSSPVGRRKPKPDLAFAHEAQPVGDPSGDGAGFASGWALAGRIGAKAPLTVGSVLVAAGLLLALQIDAGANYWTAVLTSILVIALGMAGAAAPLTTAVLNSVDARHTGSASGFNSAAARTGGLIATALLGTVLAAQGPRLTVHFHAVVVVGAIACLAAAASAFLLIGKEP